MNIYRIARTEFCDLSGEGAKIYGGRWNRQGFPALYGSSSISSALLERLTVDSELFSSERYVLYSVMEIDCPDTLVKKYSASDLPEGWDAIPHGSVSEEFGSQLLTSGLLCFGVPSVVDKSSLNFIINPMSRDFDKIDTRVLPLSLDQRIVRG
ncbi:RES family NAD+ phosphorylase [uncultured Imperialibacter sp.]|uniref:RES family NAD+ phosphorylase n=1 Tax=uncultured Imperialibacter sp. TaxID=1672639 RepID=UPI0030DCE29D|tara:strand:+ start:635 stop:1093 length:459 start_codon:yes stop_codon:yes gene_type:complete